MSALGAGGHGYFAIDITNIKSPKHLFAIENDTFNNTVKIWDSSERVKEYGYTPGIPMGNPGVDYQKLGEAWSAPYIFRIKHNGKDKWVAAVGGGFNGATNPNYGSVVYIIDIEGEGEILKTINIQLSQGQIKWLDDNKGSESRSCLLRLIVNEKMEQAA